MAEPRLQPEEEAAGVPGAAGGAVVWPPGARAERLDIPEAEHGGGGSEPGSTETACEAAAAESPVQRRRNRPEDEPCPSRRCPPGPPEQDAGAQANLMKEPSANA